MGRKLYANGSNIHLTDSANSKVVEFGLYGKAEQKQYSGKNLLEITAQTTTKEGITFTMNNDGSVTVNGTATANATHIIANEKFFVENGGKEVILSGNVPNSNVKLQIWQGVGNAPITDLGNGEKGVLVERDESLSQNVALSVVSGATVNNVTIYPMVRLASIEDSTYEPYVGGIASPNPDYPQEITVAGASGSVEVVTVNEDSTESTVSTIPTSEGLAGIPVESGGNYTDENGQQWVCDEIVKYADGSGKRIKRIGVIESYNNEEVTTGYMSTTGQLTNGAKVIYILPTPIITDLSAEEIAEIEKLYTFYPVTNISNNADCGMAVTYVSTLIDFIQPKTDWTEQDAFDYVAYNRVTGNIMHLKELADYLFSRLDEFNLETEKDNLSLIYARHMNDIENGLESINLTTYKLGIGEKKTYKPNGNVPDYQEYNRIESACLALYNQMQSHKANLPRLAFRLGNQKGIRV